jgi:hypothetical protein
MIALGLALFLMVVPLEREILWMFHRSGRVAPAVALWCICFLLVGTPLSISWRRLRRYPGRWRRGFENLIIALCILAWSIVGLIFLLLDSRAASNQSMKPTAPLRRNFRMFATTPCRGLSLYR